MEIPRIVQKDNGKVLLVNGKPFIMLCGESRNSNSSSLAYMKQVWDKADNLGLNSLLLPVTWELTEPIEGEYDFSLPDGLIDEARARGKKLGFLWFGAWKNGACSYAPQWVKTDTARFLRAEVEKGKKLTRLHEFRDMPYTALSYR